MRLLRRRGSAPGAGPPRTEAPDAASPDALASLAELRAEIELLADQNRAARSLEIEAELLRLRHLEGIRLMDDAAGEAQFVMPDPSQLPPRGAPGPNRIPVVARDRLSGGLLRAGILRDGSVRVRGLVGRDDALRFAAAIDAAFDDREQHGADVASTDRGGPSGDGRGYYDEFVPQSRFPAIGRGWIAQGGGLLAADSPRLAFELGELMRHAEVPRLVADYFGEPVLTSVEKTTLRKAMPAHVVGAWHQDGYFMGPVRSLNLWIALSRCGDIAPGIDIVPRRIENYLLTNTEEAPLDYTIAARTVTDAAGVGGIARPIFEPGDAIFFDELCVHSTASEPTMPHPRFAIENWFFGASGFPSDYAPLAA